MKVRNVQTGEVVDVSAEEAARLYQSGQYQLREGDVIPMRGAHGQIMGVDPHAIQQAQEEGFGFASEAEWDAADKQARYGSTGQRALTLAEGVGRGLTVGAYDGLAHAVSPEYAQDVIARSEANPVESIGGEVVGTVAPLLVSRGATAGASAGRIIGAAPRAAARLGLAAEQGAAAIIGTGAKTVLGRAAQRGGAMAVGGAVEALPSAIGRQVSRAYIEDRELLSEQVLAGIGLEALVGGVAGGLLGGGVSLATDGVRAAQRAFGHAAPTLERQIAGLSGALSGKSADDIVGSWKGRQAIFEAEKIAPTRMADEVTALRASIDDARAAMREAPEVVQPMGEVVKAMRRLEDAGVIAEGRANPRVMAEYLGSVTNPQTDVIHSQLRAITKDAQEAIKAAKKVQPDGPFGAAEEAIARVSKTLDDVESGTIARNQFEAISASGDGSGMVMRGLVGGMIGGAPGAAIGSAIGLLSKPADVIGKVAAIERIARLVDAKIDGGIKGYMAKISREGGPSAARIVVTEKERRSPESVYNKTLKTIEAVNAGGIDRSTRHVREYSPEVADTIGQKAQTAVEFLRSKLPTRDTMRPLTPQLDKGLPPKSELYKFAKYANAVEDPAVIVRELAKGTLTLETVEAVKAVYPALYERVREVAIEQLATMRTPPPYQARMRLGLLLDFEADPSLNADNLRAMQSSEMLNPPPMQPKSHISGSPSKTMSERLLTELDRVEGVLS